MNYFNKEIWIFYEYSISNLAFIASKEFFILQNKKTLHQLRYKVSHAEDGTWTHTSAMLTRSLVLLVCQFRHFRISRFIFKFYLLLRQLVLYQKLYKVSIVFLKFFYYFFENVFFILLNRHNTHIYSCIRLSCPDKFFQFFIKDNKFYRQSICSSHIKWIFAIRTRVLTWFT